MAFSTYDRFTFVSQAVPGDTFGVIRFTGQEGLNQCYNFEIELVSNQADLDLDRILLAPAVFTITREGGDIPFHGILAQFEQKHAVNEFVFYRAVLVPRLWWLSLTHHNQVFLKMSIPDILTAVLKDGGLAGGDFELKLQKDYPPWEYICQYRESHLAFVSRWMEREGIYFYFEQTDTGEKVILTDTILAHTAMPQGRTMSYMTPSGLDAAYREEIIQGFVCRQQMLPQTVLLKDYNYRNPSLEISGQAQVKTNGRGQVYIYGEHIRTPQEGNALAAVRAQELLCREKEFLGESFIPYLRPGYAFTLRDHYRADYNQSYLTVDLRHEGSQAGYLTAGLKSVLSDQETQVYYRNSFTAIPANVQFRPSRRTEKARFYGSMNALIDAAGSGLYAEVDEQGRYKVILPFDQSGRKDGKASAFLRMMQPYGGSNHGMHFPLHKGTEVLVTFIDGDPDRPIITGAVPNPENPSLINSDNLTKNMITTAGQNKIHMEDEVGNQRILMHSPTANSFVRLGSPNDPAPAAESIGTGNGITLHTGEGIGVYAQTMNKFIVGETTSFIGGFNSSVIGGADNKTVLGFRFDETLGLRTDLKMGGGIEFTPRYTQIHGGSLALKGQVSKLRGDFTKLDGAVTGLAGDITDLAGAHEQLKGATTTLAGEVSTLAGETSSLAGGVSRLAGNQETICGAINELNGEQNALVGELMTVSGEVASTIGTQLDTIGEHTQVVGEHTTVGGPHTTLAALNVMM